MVQNSALITTIFVAVFCFLYLFVSTVENLAAFPLRMGIISHLGLENHYINNDV